MPKYIDLLSNEEMARKKRNEAFSLAKAHIEHMHELDERKNLKIDPKSEIEVKVDKLSSHISQHQISDFAIQLKAAFAKVSEQQPTVKEIADLGPKILGVEKPEKKPSMKEIASTTPQILEAEKSTHPTPPTPPPLVESNDAEKLIPPTENLEEEAPIENTKTETAQRNKLYEMWEAAAKDLEIDLQDLFADPFESKAADKVMLLCSHLAAQMNHESARALLDFIEDTRIENLKKAYQPGWKEWTPIAVQLLTALATGFCGFYPAVSGLAGSAANGWKSASDVSNTLGNVTGNVGQLNSTMNQGKHSVVGHELESDKRLQQDLQQRRQQAEQATKRELENIKQKAQQQFETVRSINS